MARLNQSHLLYAFEVLYNITEDPSQESEASLSFIRLSVVCKAVGDLPAGSSIEVPKWPLPKWETPEFELRNEQAIEHAAKAAYLSTITKREAQRRKNFPELPIDIGLSATLSVAEKLKHRKDEWLQWALAIAQSKALADRYDQAHHRMWAEYIFNLADEEKLATDAKALWCKIVDGQERTRGIPVLVQAEYRDGKVDTTWAETVCWSPEEVLEYDRDTSPEERLVKKSFAGFETCWCEQDVKNVVFLNSRNRKCE